MSWKRWRPKYEVPKKVDKLVKAGILTDKTSSRDIVPHFETTLHDGTPVVLWVDHPDPTWRSIPDGPRYGIELFRTRDEGGVSMTTPETVFASNYLDETLKELQGILQQQGMGCL